MPFLGPVYMGVGDLPLRWGKEQWRIQGRDPGPPPFISLFLDQTKARMAEKKNFLETPPPPPPPHLSEGLDPALKK